MSRSAIASVLVHANAFAPFRFVNRSKLPVLMYHRFSEAEEFGKTSRRAFEKHLRYLTRHYKVISLSEAVSHIRDGSKLPERSAVITIDDGYRDFYHTAFPVLKNFGLPATIYLVTEFTAGNCWIWTDKARYVLNRTQIETLDFQVGRTHFCRVLGDAESRLLAAGSLNSELKKIPDDEKNSFLTELSNALKVPIPDIPPDDYAALNWDDAKEIASAGIEIGSHTAAHAILTNVDDGRLEHELHNSKDRIQNEIGTGLVHFCYPNGDVSERERQAAESAGYASAVTTELKLCENGSDLFLIPRIDAEPEMPRFIQATSGFDAFKSKGR